MVGKYTEENGIFANILVNSYTKPKIKLSKKNAIFPANGIIKAITPANIPITIMYSTMGTIKRFAKKDDMERR